MLNTPRESDLKSSKLVTAKGRRCLWAFRVATEERAPFLRRRRRSLEGARCGVEVSASLPFENCNSLNRGRRPPSRGFVAGVEEDGVLRG
ncbi:hypothetical protein SDJN03_21987, partial [Cucurbita argyrosperma subsp. sororia]